MVKNLDNFFESASGFSMPFLADEDHEVEYLLEFGQQTNPQTGNPFNHLGIDMVCRNQILLACATGVVRSTGIDPVLGPTITIRHGMYDVIYGHVKEIYVSYGSDVVAGQQIGMSGDFLHFGVRCNDQWIDPNEFLGMVFNNIMLLAQMGIDGTPQLTSFDTEVKTDYDSDKEEILALMQKYLPAYYDALNNNEYHPSKETQQQLLDNFRMGEEKNYFFETIPSPVNPLGLDKRSGLLAGKMQNILIKDFLSYLAAQKSVYLSSWSEEQKKNFMKTLTASK